MRFARVRSGLAESFDDVTVIALDADGNVLFESGEPDRPMYYRSAIKPIQALAARRTGLDLPAEHLALTCASHRGWPLHIATVRKMLSDYGLTERDLKTPPGRPLSPVADSALIARGDHTQRPVLHMCSGKHAGWLAACVTAGWDTESYLSSDHPLQQLVVEVVREYTGIDPRPVGIDGCGAPTLVGSVRGLAESFRSLDTVDELRPIATAMARFGSLVADNDPPLGRVSAVWGGPVKGGAEGCFGMVRQGVAIATKSASGNDDNAVTAALHTADRIGMLTAAMRDALQPQLHPPVIGGTQPVGSLELINA